MTNTLFIIFSLFSSNVTADCRVIDKQINQKYSGSCKDGLATGFGIAQGNDKYEGQFIEGKKQGIGTYLWQNGAEYIGEFNLDEPHGYGIYKKNGEKSHVDEIFEGHFEHGKYMFTCRNKEQCQSTIKLKELDKTLEETKKLDYVGTDACFQLKKYYGVEFYILNELRTPETYRIKEINHINRTALIERIYDWRNSSDNETKQSSCIWLSEYLKSVGQ